MSGPKDYAIRFAMARLQRIRARLEAERMARAAVVQNMLLRQKDAATARLAAKQSARASVIQTELEKRKQAALAARNQVVAAVDEVETPISAGTRAEAIASLAMEQMTNAATEAATTELHSKLAQIQGWTDTMETDQTVKDFRPAQLSDWRNAANSILADSNAGHPMTEIEDRCNTVLTQAKHIFDEAGELKGKFDTRNELLTDIIASFKEIGFHVGDPFFEHPDDPTGPVILKATCGSETVTASIDLGTTVRSVWDGVETEQCKDAFFDYVDRMKQRGIDVDPERADLRERPKLLQKGANELPRSQSSTAGG